LESEMIEGASKVLQNVTCDSKNFEP
jgi:hypothetical protein